MITANGNRAISARASIAGVVCAVPRDRVTNDDLGADAHAAAKMTGVLERRHVTAAQSTESLCQAAAERLLDRLDWAPSLIDFLVVVTQTPSMLVPASGYDLHAALGLPTHCPVVQVNWSCSGFVNGLWLAMTLAERTDGRVLLLVGDVTSRIVDPADRATAPLFGDAGSATAIQGGGDHAHTFFLGSDGAGVSKLCQEPGGHLHMDGSEVFDFTLRTVPGLLDDVLSVGPPDFILMHQANKFMLQHLIKKAQLRERAPQATIPMNIDRFGNTSSASIQLLWCSEVRASTAQRRLALAGYGAGLAWAGASVVVSEGVTAELIEV